jgi:rhodanese-related sulfurtransferase
MPHSSRRPQKSNPTKQTDPAATAQKSKFSAESSRARRAKSAQQKIRKNKSTRTGWAVALVLVGVFAAGLLIVHVISDNMPWQLSDEISPAQAKRQLGSGALIVDVRTHDEYVGGHIEQSLLMPLEELTTLMQALPHDRLIITVCRTGVRSVQARNILKQAGFTQVTTMKGGMEAWIAAGLPVVTGEPIRNN